MAERRTFNPRVSGFDPQGGYSVEPTVYWDAIDTALVGKSVDNPPDITGSRRRPQSGRRDMQSGRGSLKVLRI